MLTISNDVFGWRQPAWPKRSTLAVNREADEQRNDSTNYCFWRRHQHSTGDRPKGNSFLQLGPGTYGASGWSGADLGMEYRNLNTATPLSYGNYIEITAGDFPNGSVYGTSMFIYSKLAPTNTPHQLIGLDINTFPQLAPGQTMWQGVGTQSQTETYNDGTVQFAYGVAGYATAKRATARSRTPLQFSGISPNGYHQHAVNHFGR